MADSAERMAMSRERHRAIMAGLSGNRQEIAEKAPELAGRIDDILDEVGG